MANGWNSSAHALIHVAWPKAKGATRDDRSVVIVGDSLIGDPPGRLRLLPSDRIQDRGLLLASLTVLGALRFHTLLVGDGEPIIGGADDRVRDLLLKLI